MNWIQAYISAVKSNLPSSKRDDIASELQSLLEETLEQETGKRPSELSESETLSWLKTREHPALVAASYQERRTLVDEDSYPLFKLTLRYALIGLAVAFTTLAILTAFTSSNGGYALSLTRLGSDILHSGLLAFASIALFFHFFGKHFNARERLANWDPKELPDPKQKWEQEPLPDSVAGLVFTGIFLLLLNGFLTGIASSLANQKIPVFDVQFVEEAAALLPWINVVLIASILLYAVMIIKPRWSTTTLAVNIALSLGTAVIVYMLQNVSPMLDFTNVSAENAEHLARLQNIGSSALRITLLIVLLVSIYEIIRDTWRITRLGNRRPI